MVNLNKICVVGGGGGGGGVESDFGFQIFSLGVGGFVDLGW